MQHRTVFFKQMLFFVAIWQQFDYLARHIFRVNKSRMYIQCVLKKSRIWRTCGLIICYLTLRFYNSVVSQCLFDF